MLGTLKKVFQGQDVKRLSKIANQINEIEKTIETLSDEQLQDKTTEFRERLQAGETLDHIKPEAFAVIREAARRILGQRHYDVQLIGGLALHEGMIAEMHTGEGKTLVASLPSYLNALTGKGVHVITVNEYLARRDYEIMGQIHRFLGLTVGLNHSKLGVPEKQEAYSADITYGTGNEFGFDYLRDHMVTDQSAKVQRELHYAIIDEADSILIDEARTPLIIASHSDLSAELFALTSKVVKPFVKDIDFKSELDTMQIFLTEEGAAKIENLFDVQNLYSQEHQLLYHFVMTSLRAQFLMKKDVDYIIRNGEAMLVDSFTGRVMEGRSYTDGLQQAIEAKEGLEIRDENETQASITIQNYFRLYDKVSGMSGTVMTEKDEFFQTYGLHVAEIPTNKPKQRVDMEDLLYATAESKYAKVIHDVKHYHELGRPVLIGTTSIQQSEYISSLLQDAGLTHHLLNAKTEEQEAAIISLAGQKGQIMIATNMAGRGTDILLGEGVREIGGLHIIGTEKHESRRIDNQLRGRAGRQGDPGSSQFILSLEDELFKKIEPEQLEKLLKKLKTNSLGLVSNPEPVKFVNDVQRLIETSLFSMRANVLKLDDTADQQRRAVYSQRNDILMTDDSLQLYKDRLKQSLNNLLQNEEWTAQEWHAAALQLLPSSILPEFSAQMDEIEIKDLIEQSYHKYTKQLDELTLSEEEAQSLKTAVLRKLDVHWLSHLKDMEQLKDGIHLRGYSQEDPYRIYEREGYEMFLNMLDTANAEACADILIRMNSMTIDSENGGHSDDSH
ncbi:accessory Sec system translocase SecA2 [Fictibacillus iocasae]|uniref:Protein translocase subunit SecA n=1 Tax=Fictibacillus iocasae TaxID=2715437 RepID=A0ABW2NYM9_9BACL